jgi:hypothetical protein
MRTEPNVSARIRGSPSLPPRTAPLPLDDTDELLTETSDISPHHRLAAGRIEDKHAGNRLAPISRMQDRDPRMRITAFDYIPA